MDFWNDNKRYQDINSYCQTEGLDFEYFIYSIEKIQIDNKSQNIFSLLLSFFNLK